MGLKEEEEKQERAERNRKDVCSLRIRVRRDRARVEEIVGWGEARVRWFENMVVFGGKSNNRDVTIFG